MQVHTSYAPIRKCFYALVLTALLLLAAPFLTAKGEGAVYSLCQQSSQGYIIAAQAKEIGDGRFSIQVTLPNLSDQTPNPPINFSIYDDSGYLASAVPPAASYNDAPSQFSAQITLESSIETLYLVPVLRQGGEDEGNKTTVFAQGELAQVNLASSKSKLNLRNSPKNGSSVLSSFSTGTPVLITARPNDNWAEVSVVKEGRTFKGYMNSQFLLPMPFLEDEVFLAPTPEAENAFVTLVPNAPLPTLTNEYQSQPYQVPQPTPTPAPAYQRAYQANQHMSAGYTVTATAQEQADRPNWFTFYLTLTYDNNIVPTGNISLFYLYLNDEFFGVLTPHQASGVTAPAAGSAYALNALITDTIHSLSLIPVYDGWAKGAEVIALYALDTHALMPSTNQGGSANSAYAPPSAFQGQDNSGINTQTQPMANLPNSTYTANTMGRTFTALQTMGEGYTLYATAIEEERMNGNFTIHAFLSFDPSTTAPEFSALYLYVNEQFWGILSPYEDPWSQQWQQTAPNTFEVKIQIKTDIQSLALVPVYTNGEPAAEHIALTQDP